MRLLFAAPNRDLLQCYREILNHALGETVTAFDGTQLPGLLAEGPFDLAIVDETLPRLEHSRVAALLRREGIPMLVLRSRRTGHREEEPGLSYPFEPEDLLSLAGGLLGGGQKEQEGKTDE